MKEMADQSQFEQLDQIVNAILVRRAAAIPDDNAELVSLAHTVAALHGLPSEDFRAQLKADLERRMNVARTAVKPVREGFHTITQYLIVADAKRLIEFLNDVFGAVEKFRAQRPGSSVIMHAEV